MNDMNHRTTQCPWGSQADLIVEHYLECLRRHLAGLPRRDREDLLLEIRSHIHEAFLNDTSGSEIERILRILDRLGEPSQVLAHRVGPGLIRSGVLRKLPFYVGAGVLLIFIGLPLGLTGTSVLLFVTMALVFVVLAYYATAVALVAAGILGLITTLLKLAVPGFLVEMSDVWGMRAPNLDNLTGRLLFSLLLAALGAVLLWVGRHGLRGLRFLLRACARRVREYRERRVARAWALTG
jgi:uncharacterized membrane protein